MEYINHTKARKSKFLKRSKVLKQKIQDLVTLCDIDAAMICYGVDGELQTWPPHQEKVRQTLERYQKIPKKTRNMNMLVLHPNKPEDPIAASNPTAAAAVVDDDNAKKSDNLSQFSYDKLLKMERLLREKQEEIQKKIDIIKNQTIEVSSSSDADDDSSTDGEDMNSDDGSSSNMDEDQVDSKDSEVDQQPKQVQDALGNRSHQMPCVQQQSFQVIRPTPIRITFPYQIAQHHNFIAGISS